jgi:adenylosuccinate lyase
MATTLGLHPSLIHTQVIQRDRHATYVSSLVNLAGLIEKIMLDIRLLSRSDVGEVAEAFATHQKGSSAMPHKKNPISGENLTGLARMMRGYLNPIFENQALWHERDISHSSVERIILMDATTLLDYMFSRATQTISNLVVFPQRMQHHVDESYDTGASQWILHHAILKGIDRDEAYQSLQSASFIAMDQHQSLWKTLQQTPLATHLNMDHIRRLWQPYASIQAIYDRVFEMTV